MGAYIFRHVEQNVMVYFIFAKKSFLKGVIANDHKNLKNFIQRFSRYLNVFRADLLPLYSVFRKKGTFYDDRLGKTKNLVNSHFKLLSDRFVDFLFYKKILKFNQSGWPICWH